MPRIPGGAAPRSRYERIPAPLLVLAAIGSVQFGSAFARTLFDQLGAAGITLLRLGLGALILLVIARPSVRAWTRQSWIAVATLGVTVGCMNLVFYQSLRTIPLGVAVTVEFLGPLLLALVQTRRWIDLLWAIAAGTGVAILGLSDADHLPLTGLLLALLAGGFWAGYILASARVGALLPGMSGLSVGLLIGAMLTFPFGANGASALFNHPGLLFAALAVAVLSTAIPFALELEALRRIPTQVFGILMSLEPAMAAVAGLLVLGQRLGPREIIALVLVSAASAGITLGRRSSPPPVD